MAAYGFDVVAEFWRGSLSLRKLRAMVEWLPERSPRHVANENPWTQTHYILADLFDAVGQLGDVVNKSLGGKGIKLKRYRRPGMTDGRKIGGKAKSYEDQLDVIAKLRALSDPNAGTDKLIVQKG
jgi:hypothetical protein